MTTSGSTIAGSRPPAAQQRGDARAGGKPQPNPNDVHAMADAFAAARRQQPGGLQGKATKQGLAALKGEAERAAARAGDPGAAAEFEALTGGSRHDREGAQSGQGMALAGQAGAPVPIPVPDAPAPHVDPAAFAQLMAQLWLREREKGAKEVRVEFGRATWPTTGARIVRNADGVLDIDLMVDDGGVANGDGLADLRDRLSARGLAIGTVKLAES